VTEVIVVGAGIVGAAVARELAVRGVEVTLLDRGAVASGSTGLGEGNVLCSDKDAGPELELARAGLAMYRELEERLGGEARIRRKGALIVHRDEATWAVEPARLERMGIAGATLVGTDVVRELEPELTGELRGASLFPDDLQCDPRAIARALAREAEQAGATIREGCAVEAIVVAGAGDPAVVRGDDARLAGAGEPAVVRGDDPRLAGAGDLAAVGGDARLARAGDPAVVGGDEAAAGRAPRRAVKVIAGGERIAARAVVIAAGAWSAPLAAGAGLHLPLEPRKGQLVRLAAPAPGLVRHKVVDASYMRSVASESAALELSTVVETTWEGDVLVGSSRERRGFDTSVAPAVSSAMIERAAQLFPRLPQLAMAEAWAGLRPWLPDHLPAIGPSRAVPGLWLATGHEGAGVALGPVTGRLVAQLYAGEPPVADPAPFDPDRFGLRQAARAAERARRRHARRDR
jgi:glycine/D-amino acid oxidase-like deaminating enzyme